ncbi:MAG: type II toxin-antitoxin system RelE/ParE family toxin [Clostridia bacterium]|nr:type II toxin-antitoxin system RelE/ParE family toxin [Clostridia bacterium]
MDLIKTAGFKNIYEVEQFKKEFVKIAKKNKRYYNWLIAKLSILEEKGMEALKLEGFEPLSATTPKLYSIRYPHSPVNPRVIYVYANGNEIYLLFAFKEKNNSDYTSAIKVAHDRLKYIRENY